MADDILVVVDGQSGKQRLFVWVDAVVILHEEVAAPPIPDPSGRRGRPLDAGRMATAVSPTGRGPLAQLPQRGVGPRCIGVNMVAIAAFQHGEAMGSYGVVYYHSDQLNEFQAEGGGQSVSLRMSSVDWRYLLRCTNSSYEGSVRSTIKMTLGE